MNTPNVITIDEEVFTFAPIYSKDRSGIIYPAGKLNDNDILIFREVDENEPTGCEAHATVNWIETFPDEGLWIREKNYDVISFAVFKKIGKPQK